MAKKALGRGLSALLENADTDITGTEPEALHSIAEIKISQIIKSRKESILCSYLFFINI